MIWSELASVPFTIREIVASSRLVVRQFMVLSLGKKIITDVRRRGLGVLANGLKIQCEM